MTNIITWSISEIISLILLAGCISFLAIVFIMIWISDKCKEIKYKWKNRK